MGGRGVSGWLRFENITPEKPSIIALTDRAFRLWFACCCYCSRAETDGIVPRSTITTLTRSATRKTVAELVAAGKLEILDEDTYAVHDYLEHNPSRAELNGRRAAAKARTGKWRDKQNGSNGDASPTRHSRAQGRTR